MGDPKTQSQNRSGVLELILEALYFPQSSSVAPVVGASHAFVGVDLQDAVKGSRV